MIALFLLLAAQAAPSDPDAAPPASPPAQQAPAQPQRICRQAPGSDTVECKPAPREEISYRLPKYGPGSHQANRGKSVKLGAKASNRGPARRNRKMATVGIPF